jgi:hypothetical protein
MAIFLCLGGAGILLVILLCVCIYERVEWFDGVVFALSVNCCWKAGAQARCEVDPGS